MAVTMSEIQRRINNAIERYSCALMNDTKWREVLDLIGKHEVSVQFSFVREEKFKSVIKFPEGGYEGDHTTDCTVHGPFLLKEIFAIRCPRLEEKRELKTGRRYMDDSRYLDLMASLRSLGQLPLTEDKEGVTINGYQK
jgi:hypothetical protein